MRKIAYLIKAQKNSVWNLFGSVFYAFTQWAMLVMIAQFGNPKEVGMFSLGLAIVSPLIILTNLQLRTLQATDVDNEYMFRDYFGVRIVSLLFFFLILLTLLINSNYSSKSLMVIGIVAFYKMVESLSDVTHGLFQKELRLDLVAISKSLKGIVGLLFIFVGYSVWDSINYALFLFGFSWLTIFFIYDLIKANSFSNILPRFNFGNMKKIILFAFPLGIFNMLGSLNANIPRYFVEKIDGIETLGYFSAITYLVVAGSTIITAICQANTPYISKLFTNKNYSKFVKMVMILSLLGLVQGLLITIVCFFWGKDILNLFYGKDYIQYNSFLVLVMVAGTINYAATGLGYALNATRMYKGQPILGGVWVVFSLMTSFAIIIPYGIEGAGYVLILSAIFQFITRFLMLRGILRRFK